jgi:hypothetical protein
LSARDLGGNRDSDSIQQALMAVVNEILRNDPAQYPLLEEIRPLAK